MDKDKKDILQDLRRQAEKQAAQQQGKGQDEAGLYLIPIQFYDFIFGIVERFRKLSVTF